MTEYTECERFEKQAKVAELERRFKAYDTAVAKLFSQTKQLLKELKESELAYIASSAENGMIDLLLRNNYLLQKFEDELEKLNPPDSESLECRLCKKKGFWHN